MLDVRSECVNGNWPEFQAFRTKEGPDRLSPNAESWMAFSGRSLCERATGYTLFHIRNGGQSNVNEIQHEPTHPFHPETREWLYDELEFKEHRVPLYVHRILMSNGVERIVPFFDVMIKSIPIPNAKFATIAE